MVNTEWTLDNGRSNYSGVSHKLSSVQMFWQGHYDFFFGKHTSEMLEGNTSLRTHLDNFQHPFQKGLFLSSLGTATVECGKFYNPENIV